MIAQQARVADPTQQAVAELRVRMMISAAMIARITTLTPLTAVELRPWDIATKAGPR
jgi:hypothetical protein